MAHYFSHLRKLTRKTSRLQKYANVILLGGLGYALYSTVWSIYVNSFVDSDAIVGFISGFFVVVSFLSFLSITPLLEKSSKLKLFVISSLVVALGFLVFAFTKNLYLFLLVETILVVSFALKISSSGLLVEHNSGRKELSKNEGLIYTFSNLSFVVGPLIAGFILAKFGVRPVFLVASLFILASVLLFKIIRLKDLKRKKIDKNHLKNFKEFFRDKNRLNAYLLHSGLSFWWSLIYIFMPLLILEILGAEKEIWIGYFLFAIAVPLIFLELPFGKLASKIGFKKLFFAGFIIPAALAFLCFTFFNIWFVMICLTISSIGLAMIESTTEAYFFDILKGKEDQRFYSIYNTALDTGSIFGRVLPALVLLFFPFRAIFLVYSAGMLLLSVLSLKIKEAIESRRK